MLNAAQNNLFATAVNHIAASLGRPILYGPNDKPLRPSATYSYKRSAAKRAGSMKNWVPKRLLTRQSEEDERQTIVERSIDLVNNDPHAAGVVETFATTVVGAGLLPHPTMDGDILGLDKEKTRQLRAQQKGIYRVWSPFADAGARMTFGGVQYLLQTCLLKYGEYLMLLPMLKDNTRPYSLACQVINPMRLMTPIDKMGNKNIHDGVETGKYGEPVAYWIKRINSEAGIGFRSDTSDNFMRISAKKGHRWNVLHGFMQKDPEQVRGMPFFASAMKYFRDFNDLLDAELVANIVTAAYTLFIEVGADMDPIWPAENLSSITESEVTSSGKTKEVRYEEMTPGIIMYGNTGEKPHPIVANRPGTTFEPFVKTIKKSLAMALNMPYPVLFKDVENVNYAGFRSAMLDAWRVFTYYRTWLGQGDCQKVFTMLQEEAWLKGDLDYKDFYEDMYTLTTAEWRGSPKGDIEPIKAVQADILAIQHNLKTRAEVIAERGGDLRTTFDQLEEEQGELVAKGLTEEALVVSEDKVVEEDDEK